MSQTLWARVFCIASVKTIKYTIAKIWVNEEKKVVYRFYKVTYIKAAKQQVGSDWKNLRLIQIEIIDGKRFNKIQFN